ncbi:type I-E CRISPR-associated protein Cse2/CasB [Rhodococcus qingshengii]|uniref:type I-E CRISPR-associated protein Cse2/CasB n=1 Tax=Rhodococcus qingshengii TaxID=334542 RepID=UPI001F134C03|nr:type I-E CRISPR-associated protein Cse2/CasB [Rhodococcus qingshengii]ULD39029.1 type I-E CRISPR-associated protein Cse2/CasB [Rhodococcus qingshengii]
MTDLDLTDTTPATRYITSLGAAVKSNDRAVTALRTWRPSNAVNVDIIRITSRADDDQWIAWALAGKLFARWHTGRASIRYGTPATGLGHGLRNLGARGSRGPNNPGAVRLLDRLLAAGNDTALADVLDAIGRELRTLDYPPHWATIVDEISAWRNTGTRKDIQITWARQFSTYQPNAAATAAES